MSAFLVNSSNSNSLLLSSAKSPQYLKGYFEATTAFFNHPAIKESIKHIAGTITLAFGVAEAYDLVQIVRGRKISTEVAVGSTEWVEVAKKIAIIGAKISLILSASVSKPGIFLISTLLGRVFTTSQLENAFGSYTTFAVNPWHPRHIVSFVAIICAVPSLIQSSYEGSEWLYRKVIHLINPPSSFKQTVCQTTGWTTQKLSNLIRQPEQWLTDIKVRGMVVFNTATSRPVLHIANQMARWIIKHL